MKILAYRPASALPGGVVRIEVSGLDRLDGLQVDVGGQPAEVLGASSTFVTIRVPETSDGHLSVRSDGRAASGELQVGKVLARDLHPVANPVVDSRGRVFVTFSGSRGESVPFGVFVVEPGEEKQPFLGDITNPTGLAIGPGGDLYISSRHTGTVYRSTLDKQLEKYVDGLGIATGITFDSKGNLFVGDRSGIVYKVSPGRDVTRFCEIEPSVSAFHLAVDREDWIYLAGPTLATQDAIYRISPEGAVETFFKGFGRPQGLAFDRWGRLYATGSYRGRKGLYVLAGPEPELLVASPMLVGVAVVSSRTRHKLYLVDNESLFEIEIK